MSRIDHDRLYKTLLRTFFKEFIELFFPELAHAIDFRFVKFLSEEVVVDIQGSKSRRLDLLIETKLKGEEAVILVHLEPQAYPDPEFAGRMFIYTSRLYEIYRKRIVPIAVFSSKRKKTEPEQFGWEFPFRKVLRFEFFAIQLRKRNWRDFIRGDNPVAAALLSSLGYNRRERVQVKLEFLHMMTRLRLDPARMELLTVFFETYLPLKPQEEEQLQLEIDKSPLKKEVRMMEWITSWEKKGRQEGRQEEKADIAIKMMKENLDPALVSKVTGLSLEELHKLKQTAH